MLRRRSEFWLFLDSARATEGREEREAREPSPRDEYLQVLLEMKTTSDVS